MISLIPYLNSSQKSSYLKISLVSHDNAILEKASYPFLLISDLDPLTRIVGAQFLTDAGSEIKNLFLIMQKEQYLLQKDELRSFTNRDIEHFWENAFSFNRKMQGFGSLHLLQNQINEKGGLEPFQPLFFCKKRQRYFYPPCPRCGSHLQQCYDDDLLIQSGLSPYSHSLKRYLFCAPCTQSKSETFYVHERGHTDPPSLKDGWSLIQEFGLLYEKKLFSDQSPCSDCLHADECYRSDQLASIRIVPFSFYPFYMFLFDAMSLNSIDYIALVSGTSIEELESHLESKRELGRIHCLRALPPNVLSPGRFLFQDDDRQYLEILYLKLSLLREVFKILTSDADFFTHPDFRISLDRIWITLADQSALLPFFWNFQVKVFDIGTPVFDTPSLGNPAGYQNFSYMALVWFYTLLINRKQDSARVFQSIKDAAHNLDFTDNPSSPNLSGAASDRTFSPENLFWNPENRTVPKSGVFLWERALDIGWTLLKICYQNRPDWSIEDFSKKIDSLREDTKKSLFQTVSGDDHTEAIRVQQAEKDSIDAAISTILKKITEKWHQTIPEEELNETVMISSPHPKQEILSSPKPTEAQSSPENALAETVILGQMKDTTRPSQRSQSKREEDLSSTQMIQPTEKKAVEKTQGDDFLSETVILDPRDTRDRKKRKISDEYQIPSRRAGQGTKNNL